MTTPDLRAHCAAQAAHPAWQHKLRRSARLRLALTEPGLNFSALHAALALLEDELRRQLLAGHPEAAAAPQAAATAAQLVYHGQQALLAQPAAPEALRRELPVTEFTLPLRRTCRPPAGGWRLAA